MAENQNEEMEQIEDCEEQDPVIEEDLQVKIKDVVKASALHFLPAKILARFRCVSREWDQWVKSPIFALHQSCNFRNLSGFFCQYDNGDVTFMTLNNQAYGVPDSSLHFLPEFVKIRSSSGGLLLCQGQGHSNNSYYICNPVTKQWKVLHVPTYYHDSQITAVVLVFEPSLLNINPYYKVICAVPLVDQPGVIYFEVYSSETESWKQSNQVLLDLEYTTIFQGDGFYMNGNAYWGTTERKVLAFCVTTDSYEIISLPSDCPRGGVLTQMHGKLCYIGIVRNSGKEYSLKIHGGTGLKSKRVYDISLNIEFSDETCESTFYRVMPCLEDGVVMIVVGSSIFSYRLKDQSSELMREGVGSSRVIVTCLPYVNNLVSVS